MPNFSAGSASVDISPNFDGFITKLRDDLDRVDANFDVDIRPDISGFAGHLDTELQRVNATFEVEIRPGSITAFADLLRTDLQRVNATVDVNVRPDFDRAEFDRVLATYRPTVYANIIPVLDQTRYADIERALDQLARRRTVDINVNRGGLSGVSGAADNATHSLTAMSAVKFTALAAGIAALVPILLGAAGAAGGLLAAFGAIGGAGAIGGSGIIGAFSSMKAATEGASAAATQHANDLGQVVDAQNRVNDSQHNEMDSLQRVEDAQKNLTQARVDAKDAMDNLNLSVKDGELSERGSELAYRRAVVNLQKVQAQAAKGKATGLDVETAQLGVDQAAQNITDVRVRNDQTKVKAADANAKGIDGSDQVVAAQRQLEQAQYAGVQAQIQTAQAVRELAKAQDEAGKSGLAAAGGSDAFAKAMAKLAPSAQDFVLQMRALGPQWTELRKAVQENLFAGLGDSITQLANSQLPALKDGLSQIATGMNTAIKDTLSSLDTLFTQLQNSGTMQAFIDGITQAMQGMAPFVTGLTSAFIQLGAIIGPHLGPFFAALGTAIDKIAGPLGQIGGVFLDTLTNLLPTLTELITAMSDGLAPVLPVVGRLLDAIGQALIPLIGPISQIAQIIGNALADAITAIAPYLPVIAQAFADVLTAVSPLVKPLAELFGIIAGAIAQNISSLAVALAPVVQQLADGLVPIMPILVDMFKQLTPIFAQVALTLAQGLSKALEKIMPILPDLVQSFADLFIKLAPLLPPLAELGAQLLPVLADMFLLLAPYVLDLLKHLTELADFIVPILIPAIQDMADFVSFAADAIRDALHDMKSDVDSLGDKFDEVVGKIKQIWNDLIELFKSGGIGGIAGKVVDKAIDLLPGHATGGAISGPGTGTSDSIIARLSDGEFVVNADSTRKYRPQLEAINAGALPGFKDGGEVDAKTDADIKQAQAKIAELDASARAAYAAGNKAQGDQYAAAEQQIINRLSAGVAPGSVPATAPGLPGAPKTSSPGVTTGTVTGTKSGAIVDSMAAVVAAKFPTMQLTSGLRYTDKGYHSQGKAGDFSNGTDDTPEMQALAHYIAQNYPQSLELIHQPGTDNIKDGKNVGDGLSLYGAKTMSEHRNHVHWAIGAPVSVPATQSVTPKPLTTGTPASPDAANNPDNYSPTGTYIGPSTVDTTKDTQEAKKDELPQQYSLQGIFSKAGSILATGLLSAFGLENSVLSENNVYNKAVQTTSDFYTKKDQAAQAGNATVPSTPESPRDPVAPAQAAPAAAAPKHVYDPKAGAEQWRSTVLEVLKGTGRDAGLADRTLAQIGIESGGNPNAQNNTDINALHGVPSIGLLQVIKPTFDANVDSRFPGTQRDPEPNIAAAYNYVDKRYQGAAKIWPTTAGYADGGLVSGPGTGTSDSILARLSHGEFVVNATASAANSDWLHAINASSTGRAAALPSGFAVRGGDVQTSHRDQSLNFYGDTHVMNPSDFVDAVDRHQSKQAIGLSAALI